MSTQKRIDLEKKRDALLDELKAIQHELDIIDALEVIDAGEKAKHVHVKSAGVTVLTAAPVRVGADVLDLNNYFFSYNVEAKKWKYIGNIADENEISFSKNAHYELIFDT